MSTTSPRPGTPAAPDHETRRARLAVALLFLTNGALFSNLLPRYPAIKEALDLSNASFGLAVAAGPVGAIVAGLAASWLIRRFRSSRVAVVGTVVTAVVVLLAGLSPVGALFAAALFVAGALDAIVDVAQNSHGLRVQRRYGRSILNSFHAIWSVGAVAGGLMGGAAAGLGVPIGVHLAISGVVFGVVAVVSYRLMLRGPEPASELEEAPATPTEGVASSSTSAPVPVAGAGSDAGARVRRSAVKLGTWGVLVALVLIAASGTVVEDAGNTWAALYLSGSLGAGVTVAALGFVALQGAQFVGRILGDRLVDRFGQRAVARVGGALVFVGMGQALAFPSIGTTILGFALAGFGVATLIPAAMHAADMLPGFRPGTGLTLVSWLMRLGFLAAPPLIGAVADASSLRVGLLLIPAVGLVVLALSGVLAGRRRPLPHPHG
ncbi:MFS transporter [Frigoribacterium sp. VKM Ac-2530]|uniref:MFS transporter n=1 Tax=Frigoribacterium sp. VKM Ac-2530 TaxID=2783822 RepID=UPI00188BC9DB|nr:MFS transporter [Frigoribacterium sp. VKM Ac-2530]MBF4579230.1 MFS transporter [Frigoribacterium sp. VKM Ac-2530]